MPEPLSPEDYAAAEGARCPACGSEERQQEVDWNATTRRTVVQTADCLACGATWDAVYALTGYSGLTTPTPEEAWPKSQA